MVLGTVLKLGKLNLSLSLGDYIFVSLIIVSVFVYFSSEKLKTSVLIVKSLAGALGILFSCFFHELTHVSALLWIGALPKEIETHVFFVVCRNHLELLETGKMPLVVLAGPLANALLASILVVFLLRMADSPAREVVRFLTYSNVMLFRVSFLPIWFLDAGNALFWFFSFYFGEGWGMAISGAISLITLIFVFWPRKKPKKHLEDLIEKL